MDENKDSGDHSQEPVKPAAGGTKPNNGMTVVGINILVLVGYTLVCKIAGSGGFVLDAFIIFIHVIFCIIMAIAKRSGAWVLSAFLVLAIGFSTCYMLGITV